VDALAIYNVPEIFKFGHAEPAFYRIKAQAGVTKTVKQFG